MSGTLNFQLPNFRGFEIANTPLAYAIFTAQKPIDKTVVILFYVCRVIYNKSEFCSTSQKYCSRVT